MNQNSTFKVDTGLNSTLNLDPGGFVDTGHNSTWSHDHRVSILRENMLGVKIQCGIETCLSSRVVDTLVV